MPRMGLYVGRICSDLYSNTIGLKYSATGFDNRAQLKFSPLLTDYKLIEDNNARCFR